MSRFGSIARHWRRAALGLAAALALGLAAPASAHVLLHAGADLVTLAKKVQYHCPMCPTIKSDKPGDCPKCGMKLEPVKDKQ